MDSQKSRNLPISGNTIFVSRLQLIYNQLFSFWPQIRHYYYKSRTMKTMINFLNALVNTFTFSKERMPALIPVRVVTKVRPDQHR